MRDYIFTFGFDHTHPDTGAKLANHYIVIKADSAEKAREKMMTKFGNKWAFQYNSRAHAGVEKWNLIELKEDL